MPDPNPITTAVDALAGPLGGSEALTARDALAVLDHEAAVEAVVDPTGYVHANLATGTRVLVVPFRSEGGDHADG